MYTSIAQILAIAFLAAPLVGGLESAPSSNMERRYTGSNAVMASLIARNPDLLPSRDLSLRHHTEAQIAAKKAKAANRDLELVESREAHHLGVKREAHHTEAQIAAKKAKAAGRDLDVETREPHHTEAQIAAKKAKAAGRDVEARAPHHTEAQIAAKKAKASS